MKKVLIKATNLVKKYKKHTATNGISLEINQGEAVAIIGDNGAGKTTLVSMLASVLAPTSGTIEYSFEKSNNPKENIGMQFQANSFPKGLKVKDLIEFYKDITEGKIDTKLFEEHMNAFGIEDLMDKEANSLSGGQKQRLNILIALLVDPEVIILDEVSTGLDIGVRYRLLNYIQKLKKEMNKTIIIVSHSVDEIGALADRIVLVENGKIIDDKQLSDIEAQKGGLASYLENYFTKEEEKVC